MAPSNLGHTIRRARLQKGLTLQDVAAASGLSRGFLSQMERGLSQASVGSLRRVTEALGLTMAELFDISEANGTKVLRAEMRPHLPFGDNAAKYLLTIHPQPTFEAFTVVFGPGGSTGSAQYQHAGEDELIVVVSGAICLELDDESLELYEHDSITFSSARPHRVANIAPGDSTIVWFVSRSTVPLSRRELSQSSDG